jgi:RNA polymerase sigma-B factor
VFAPSPAPTTIEDLGRAVARADRAVERLEDALDACRAARTVPRGKGRSDRSRVPGVDERTWLLHVRFARTRCPHTLHELVVEYDRYAASLAVRLHRDHEMLDDLRQVAREALVGALQRFDPDRQIPFPALATPTILGALRRHYRDRGWAVRVPRRVHDLAVAARRAEEELTALLARPPRPDEVAEHLHVDLDDLLEVLDAVHCRNALSIDRSREVDGEPSGAVVNLGDTSYLHIDDRLALGRALAVLSDREREVVRLYFFEERPQTMIAERFGVSQMQVSRWLSSIVRRLRTDLAS